MNMSQNCKKRKLQEPLQIIKPNLAAPGRAGFRDRKQGGEAAAGRIKGRRRAIGMTY